MCPSVRGPHDGAVRRTEAGAGRPTSGAYADDEVELARGCDAVVIATDCQQYRTLPLEEMRAAMRGDLLLDARNLLTPALVAGAGFTYVGIGR